MKNKLTLLLGASALALAIPARADVVAVDLGTADPPTTLGAYTLSAFVPNITGAFDATVPTTWATWGQGYSGPVYESGGNPVTIELSGVHAIDFYAEPNYFSLYNITATDSSGATLTEAVEGYAGASGFGFYENGPGTLTSITVTADPAAGGFALGEFGKDGGTVTGSVGGTTVPAPEPAQMASSLLVAGLGGLSLAARRRWSRS